MLSHKLVSFRFTTWCGYGLSSRPLHSHFKECFLSPFKGPIIEAFIDPTWLRLGGSRHQNIIFPILHNPIICEKAVPLHYIGFNSNMFSPSLALLQCFMPVGLSPFPGHKCDRKYVFELKVVKSNHSMSRKKWRSCGSQICIGNVPVTRKISAALKSCKFWSALERKDVLELASCMNG